MLIYTDEEDENGEELLVPVDNYITYPTMKGTIYLNGIGYM